MSRAGAGGAEVGAVAGGARRDVAGGGGVGAVAGAVDAVVDRLAARLYDVVVGDDPERWVALGPEDRRGALVDAARRADPLLAEGLVDRAVGRALDRLGGLGPLQPILADPTVTEVMVNGGGAVWVERAGDVERYPLSLDEETVLHLIERIVAPVGRRVDRSSPLVDARLPDGSRVNAIVRPVAVDGPCLTIRRFGVAAVGLDRFACGPVADLLRWAVAARMNVVISGGTGSGKTTLLNALAASIPRHERVVTIEDTAELHLDAPHVVRLEARPANAEGVGELRVRDLVRNALRMRPDRLIVGEVRGGEALDLLQAINTGHEGSLSTCHANRPADALRRLETMALMSPVDLPLAAVREQVQASVDLVVQVARADGGRRRVVAVDEVDAVRRDGRAGPVTTTPLVRGDRVVAAPRRPPRVAPAALTPPRVGTGATPVRRPVAMRSAGAGRAGREGPVVREGRGGREGPVVREGRGGREGPVVREGRAGREGPVVREGRAGREGPVSREGRSDGQGRSAGEGS